MIAEVVDREHLSKFLYEQDKQAGEKIMAVNTLLRNKNSPAQARLLLRYLQ